MSYIRSSLNPGVFSAAKLQIWAGIQSNIVPVNPVLFVMDTTSVGQILSALAFAADKHRHQRRKDEAATPYINHPIGLVAILWHEAEVTDPAVLMAALLHDTVEDTDTNFGELADRFGRTVASIVQEVTDDKSQPKAVRKQQQIHHAATATEAARLVKLADKIHNLRDLTQSPPSGWSVERQLEYCEWSKQVVDQMRGTHPRLEALFDDVYAAAIDQYQGIDLA